MKLSNGTEIVTSGKPKRKGADYHFKDAGGGEHAISVGRVVEVEPALMAREEKRALMPVQPKAPKHWYLLWLAGASGPAPEAEACPGAA